jgi:hypothetical protein
MICKFLYNEELAVWVALIWLTTPIITYGSLVASTDSLMLFFEAMALYFFLCAIKTNNFSLWFLIGIIFGFGVLSKYTAVFFIVSLLFYLYWSNQFKQNFLGITVALVILFFLLLPNILWNYNQHFATFLHVANDNIGLNSFDFKITRIFKFWLSQFVCLSPIICVGFCLYLKEVWNKNKSNNDKLFLSVFLLFGFFISLNSFFSIVKIHWAAIVYYPIVICGTFYLYEKKQIKYIKLSLLINIMIMLIFYSVILLCANLYQEKKISNHVYYLSLSNDWSQLTLNLQKFYNQHTTALYLFDSREYMFKSLYYMGLNLNQTFALINKNSSTRYDLLLKTKLDNFKGKNFIYLSATKNPEISKYFLKKKTIETIEWGANNYSKKLYWLELIDYQGQG